MASPRRASVNPWRLASFCRETRFPRVRTLPNGRGSDSKSRSFNETIRAPTVREGLLRRRMAVSRQKLASFCRETRKLLLRHGLTISRTIRPQTDFAGACESRSHKAVCAARCPGWFVIGSIDRPQLMQEQILNKCCGDRKNGG